MSGYDSYSDVELTTMLQQGDLDAFTAIHRRYYGILYSHAYKKLPEREEIKDVLQELFTYIWNSRETINFNANLKAYLYTATKNRILNYFKHQKIKSAYVSFSEAFSVNNTPAPDENFQIKELIALIDAEVAALPPQMRIIFEMSRNANLSHREIADKLNISPLTVKKQVNNSLKILRIKLGTYFFVLFL